VNEPILTIEQNTTTLTCPCVVSTFLLNYSVAEFRR